MKTAGKEVKVIRLVHRSLGPYAVSDHGEHFGCTTLQDLIQELADRGYDFMGQIGEFRPTGVCADPIDTYLFTRERV